jgi:hypothetical protein
MKNNLAVVIFYLIFILFAIAADFFLIRNLIQHHRASTFATVQGRISENEVKRQAVRKGRIDTKIIRYTYHIMGKNYQGDINSFFERSWSYDDINNYPIGKEVTGQVSATVDRWRISDRRPIFVKIRHLPIDVFTLTKRMSKQKSPYLSAGTA